MMSFEEGEVAINQGIQVDTRHWKGQGNGFSPQRLPKEPALLTNTLDRAQSQSGILTSRPIINLSWLYFLILNKIFSITIDI